jgi:hypothetical protein
MNQLIKRISVHQADLVKAEKEGVLGNI